MENIKVKKAPKRLKAGMARQGRGRQPVQGKGGPRQPASGLQRNSLLAGSQPQLCLVAILSQLCLLATLHQLED